MIATRREKVKFLADNRDHWPVVGASLFPLAGRMRAAGLYSATTLLPDIVMALPSLLLKAQLLPTVAPVAAKPTCRHKNWKPARFPTACPDCHYLLAP